MKTKDNIELELAATIKTARTSIRLKHSIAADNEINATLPKIEKAFHKAVALGEVFSLDAFKL